MPDWATVVLPIMTGLIGVLGGLGGTWLGVAQARDQERRRTLGEAGAEFAKRIGGAANAVQYAVDGGHQDGGPVDEAENLVGETANVLAPVELQFDDEIGATARLGRQHLQAAIAALRSGDRDAARGEYELAEAARADFNRLARAAIWSSGDGSRRRWRPA